MLTKKDERAKYLNFSKPYVTLQYAIVTPKNSAAAVSFADLGRKRVGTNRATAVNAYLKKNYPVFRAPNLDPRTSLMKLHLFRQDLQDYQDFFALVYLSCPSC